MSLQLHPSASTSQANLDRPAGRAQPSGRDAIGSGAIADAMRDAALLAAAGLAATAIVFYVLDRTVGLPNATSDIGNRVEPLGLASLVVEGFVVAVGIGGFLATRRRA